MNFLYPDFLWASLIIAVPVIIHLFNFRRYKTIYFSRVKFLKEATEDSRSGLKLKHLIILFSRILALLFLVLAFAQPYKPTESENTPENTSIIYIDNSFSMEAAGSDGNLLNEAKNKAIELVKSFDQTEKIALFTSDLASDQYRYYPAFDIIDRIKKIDFSARSTQLSTVLNAQVDLILSQERKSNNRIFVFSDFQKSTSNLKDFRREEIPCYYYQTQSYDPANIYIDSVWFESPVHRIDAAVDLFFRIQNTSTISQENLSITLQIEGNQPAPKRINVDANSSAIGSINYTDVSPGIKKGKLSIATSQLFFDDSYYFTYEIKENVEILLVKNSVSDFKNLEQLYGLDSYYQCEVSTIDGLKQEMIKNKELIILQNIQYLSGGLQDLLNQSLKEGATLVLIPGQDPDRSSWNSFLREHALPEFDSPNKKGELSYFNSEDPLYSGVFEEKPSQYKFPEIQKSFQLNVKGNQNFVTLFGFNETQPYLYYAPKANGRIIFMASPMDPSFSNFQNHALFAASFLRFAETSTFQKPLSMTLGAMTNYPLTREMNEKNPIHLLNAESKIDYIPLVLNSGNSRLISFAQIQDELKLSGFYDLTNQLNFNDVLALNYNRVESNVACLNTNEIKEMFTAANWNDSQALTNESNGKLVVQNLKTAEWWRVCLILALLFFAVEILLLKFWKT